MELKIESENDNKLLGRKEITATINFNATTPSKEQIKELIGGRLGSNRELTVIRKIEGEYGRKRITVRVHVYSDPEILKKTEPEYVKKRNSPHQEEKKEEASAPKQKPKKEGEN